MTLEIAVIKAAGWHMGLWAFIIGGFVSTRVLGEAKQKFPFKSKIQ